MRKILNVLLVLLLTTIDLCAQEGEEVTYYYEGSNSVIAETGRMLENNKKHGKWKYYGMDGKINEIIYYDNGIKHGKHVKFNSLTNETEQIITYENGEIDGVAKLFYSNSYPEHKDKVQYEYNIEKGTIKHFIYNNNIEAYYNQGFYVIYKPQIGDPLSHYKYELYWFILNYTSSYTGSYFEYYEDNQLYKSGAYKEGKKDGFWKIYHNNGVLWAEGEYQNGEKIGKWIVYHNNKQIESTGKYIIGPNGMSSPWGILKYYFKNGSLNSEGNWDLMNEKYRGLNETICSDYKQYYENGNVEWVRTKTLENESTIEYYENGKLKSEEYKLFNEESGKYEIKTGTWNYYNKDGSLEKSETYKNGEKQ